MSKTLENNDVRWNSDWLKSVTEKQAVKSLRSQYEVNTIIKMWKIANGLTVPDYLVAEDEAKPKRKRTAKKKEEAQD